MSGLTQDIANRCQAVLKLSKQQGSMMHELRMLDASVNPGRLRELICELQSLQCGIQAECNSIKVALAAEAMTGGVPMVATVPVDELELHPANWSEPDQRETIPPNRSVPQRAPSAEELERMSRTLHAAGDHTLDPEEVLP